MKKNSKTGVKIISECRELMRGQVIHGNREKEQVLQSNGTIFKGVRILKKEENENVWKNGKKDSEHSVPGLGNKTNRSTLKIVVEKAAVAVAGQVG